MTYYLPMISIICLISASITFGLGVFVFAKNPKSHIHQLFLLLSTAGSFWAFFEYMLRQATEPSFAAYWNMIGAGWIITLPLALHFTLSFTNHPLGRRDKLPFLIPTLYLPTFIFAAYDLLHAWTYDFLFIPGYGFDATPGHEHQLYYVEILFAFVIVFLVILTGFSSFCAIPKSEKRKRRQLLLVMSGIFFPAGAGISGILLFPTIANGVSVSVAIGFLGYVICISIAMLKYGLFIVTPKTASDTILATIPDALFLTGTDGRIIYQNPASLSLNQDHTPDTGLKNLKDLITPDSFNQFVATIERKGSISDNELVIQTDMGEISVSVAGSFVRDPDGVPAGIVFIIRNISDRKAAETALLQAREKLSLLNRITRHDILNLLTGIIGYLDIAKDTAKDLDDSLYHSLEKCENLSERIKEHIRFAGQYHDAETTKPEWHSLEDLVARLTSELCRTIAIEAEITPVEVHADPLIYKVLYNLAENSVRHGKHATLVKIRVKEDTDSLIIIAEDNGCGVPYDEKTRIFEPGYGKNSGLGLSFCQDILAYTGISIKETGIPSHGVRFEFTIPPESWRERKN